MYNGEHLPKEWYATGVAWGRKPMLGSDSFPGAKCQPHLSRSKSLWKEGGGRPCPARTGCQTAQEMAFSPGPIYWGFLWRCSTLISSPENGPKRVGGGLTGFLCFPVLLLGPPPCAKYSLEKESGLIISQSPCFRLPCLSPASLWGIITISCALGTGTCNTVWKRSGLTVVSGIFQLGTGSMGCSAPRDTLAAQARTVTGPVSGQRCSVGYPCVKGFQVTSGEDAEI